jgi:hypothetical protein
MPLCSAPVKHDKLETRTQQAPAADRASVGGRFDLKREKRGRCHDATHHKENPVATDRTQEIAALH